MNSCRYISQICYQNSSFYAQNISILPLYNKIYNKISPFYPKGFDGDTCEIDPDTPVYFANWVDHLGKVFAENLDLQNWVQLQVGGVNLSINDWMDLDIFMREAVKYSANKVFTEQRKDAEKTKQEMQQKLENSGPYKSPFEGISKPSFFQQ